MLLPWVDAHPRVVFAALVVLLVVLLWQMARSRWPGLGRWWNAAPGGTAGGAAGGSAAGGSAAGGGAAGGGAAGGGAADAAGAAGAPSEEDRLIQGINRGA